MRGLTPIRQIGARYWKPIVSLLAILPSAFEFINKFSHGKSTLEPKPWWLLVFGILLLVLVRFPRIAITITRCLLPPIEPELVKTAVFRGPAPFREDDSESFFGRDDEVKRCWLALEGAQFFVLDGESGSGKSSFLSAALLPRARDSFTVVLSRVGENPFAQLHAALLETGVAKDEPSSFEPGPKLLEDTLAAAVIPKDRPLLVCLDQFDELFVTTSQESRSWFLCTLARLVASKRLRVLLCIRSDFLDLLLKECRQADPQQTALSLEHFFTLDAFRPDVAEQVMNRLLLPLHHDDPIRKAGLEDFASALVGELLRTTTDKRRPLDDAKVVLAVEMQITGFMAEWMVGGNKLTRQTLEALGGKLGLYRAYIESAKDYVWRATGVAGQDSLLILRQLISPAATKHTQSVGEISQRLGRPAADVARVLRCFADKYLVRRRPAPTEDLSDQRYELMHEYLTQVLREAPQPYLQKLRDAEERLAFWSERAKRMLAPAIQPLHEATDMPFPADEQAKKAPVGRTGLVARLRAAFTQPIPLFEILSLWRYSSTPPERRMLIHSLRGFTIKLSASLLLAAVCAGGLYLWWTSDAHQVELLVGDAPYKDQVANEKGIDSWVEALALLGKDDAVSARPRFEGA